MHGVRETPGTLPSWVAWIASSGTFLIVPGQISGVLQDMSPVEGHGDVSTRKVIRKLGNAAIWQQVGLPTLSATGFVAVRPAGTAARTMYSELRKAKRVNYR